MDTVIPKEIAIYEPCVRLLFHPFMVSNSDYKLKREAMLPRPNGREVSLFRLNYTTIENCEAMGHSMNYGENEFWGYAIVTVKDVEETNQTCDGAEAHIVYAPMHKGEYVPTDIDLCVDDENVDLPMHADMVYTEPLPREACKARTAMRKYASSLVKRMNRSLEKSTQSI